MFKNIIEAFKIKEVRRKIWLTLAILLVYRIGCWIPTPGIELGAFSSSVGGNDFLGIISGISGNALSNGALLALGVLPYINASIIMQLLTIAIPKLERLARHGGDEGRKKITFYTRIAALVLALAQSIGIVVSFGSGMLDTSAIGNATIVGIIVVLMLTAGAMFTVWLGEKITAIGIGNGQSLLIFVGILSTAATAIANEIAQVVDNIDRIWTFGVFLVAVVLIFGFIVLIDLAERRVPVQYAKQIKGRKMYGGQSTFIPIKINSSGVMPIIFAMAIISFPQLIYSMVAGNAGGYPSYLAMGGWLYTIIVALLILFFSYFYSQATFNPVDVSRRIQQNGGFIPGIRAGQPTAEYLAKISRRITLFGAIFLATIALIPALVFGFVGGGSSIVNAFSATGLIIVVSVALEFNKQLEAQLLMRNYKGFLK